MYIMRIILNSDLICSRYTSANFHVVVHRRPRGEYATVDILCLTKSCGESITCSTAAEMLGPPCKYHLSKIHIDSY